MKCWSKKDSASPKAGMWRSRPRIGPPRVTTAIQSAAGSAVLVGQSVKSGKSCPFGNGSENPTTLDGEPARYESAPGGGGLGRLRDTLRGFFP